MIELLVCWNQLASRFVINWRPKKRFNIFNDWKVITDVVGYNNERPIYYTVHEKHIAIADALRYKDNPEILLDHILQNVKLMEKLKKEHDDLFKSVKI